MVLGELNPIGLPTYRPIEMQLGRSSSVPWTSCILNIGPQIGLDKLGFGCYTNSMKNRINDVLKWAGCLAVCAGALTTSLRIDPLNIYLLNLGALLYLVWAVRIKETNLIAVNGVLLALYFVGLFHK